MTARVDPNASPVQGPSDIGANLDAAARGVHLLRGHSGAGVRELQRALNARGFHLEEDGKFGPLTEAAVREFQQITGAKVDGVVGPETVGKLRANAGRVVPDGYQSPSQSIQTNSINPPSGGNEQWEFYAAMVRKAGGEVNPGGQPTVLGLRQGRGSSARAYDDQFVVLLPDHRVFVFKGATHPGQNSSSASPDVTGDGAGDVGMIRPGNYKVVPNGPHAGNASFRVETLGGGGYLPGWRDTNHDGQFDEGEVGRSTGRGDSLSGVLFHQGNAYSPSSIGCQTMSPSTYNEFLRAIGGGSASFSYTLVSV